MFDQNAHQLPVSDIDIVGPLDPAVDPQAGEGVGQPQRRRLQKRKLILHGEEPRLPDK